MKKIFNILSICFTILCVCSCQKEIQYDKITIDSQYTSRELNTQNENEFKDLEDGMVLIDVMLVCDEQHYSDIDRIKNPLTMMPDDDKVTMDEVNSMKKSVRVQLQEYHYKKNLRVAESIKLSKYQYRNVSNALPNIIYIYEPKVYVEYQDKILAELSNNVGVARIHVRDINTSIKPQVNYSVEYAGAHRSLKSIYDGSGVNVGIIEHGCVDPTTPELLNTSKVLPVLAYNGVSEHATDMALIIAGEGGVAPGATLVYPCGLGLEQLEIPQMVENDVDIVNMSYVHLKYGTGRVVRDYDEVSAYVDYAAHTYNILFFAAAGNNGDEPENCIGNPGLAYNVVTVGALVGDDRAARFTSSHVENDIVQKPTIAVNGCYIEIPGRDEISDGTSCSSAIASGIAALLFQKKPVLKARPTEAIALLAANCTRLQNYNYSSTRTLNEYIGAGALTMDNIFNHDVDLNTSSYYTYNQQTNRVMSTYVRVEQGDTIRMALSWWAKSIDKVGATVMGNYDLIVRYNEEICAKSEATNSALEVLEYQVPRDGLYMITIERRMSTTVFDRDTLSYYLWTGDLIDMTNHG